LVLGCTSSGKTPQEWEDKASRHMVLRVKSCIHTHTHTHIYAHNISQYLGTLHVEIFCELENSIIIIPTVIIHKKSQELHTCITY
jgi:hypothetical protein